MSLSRSLELFFIDGRPDGMLTAQVFNWTGHVLRIPRTQLKDGLARKEARFTGVYVLLGEQTSNLMAYVGEAEDMAARLRQHAASKDWWDTAILITTSADNLHKAHVRYLESRLIEIAKDVAATALENSNQPGGSSLSEADTANMESFLETLLMVLPAIRVDNFLSKKRPHLTPIENTPQKTGRREDIFFECKLLREDIHAKAVFRNGEMIVLTGSSTSTDWRGSDHKTYLRLRTELFQSGVLQNGKFTADFAFSSPTAAAAVVLGRRANGRTEWKIIGSGQTYADWETAQLDEAAP
ncbi:GIY-YIG nuclease family protein [Octadecabacter sp.]|nr:GIY-YIG nuclease family protein [Octadecabacter sp.]